MQTIVTRRRLLPVMILMLLASPATAQYATSDDQIDQLLAKITSDSHETMWQKFKSSTGNMFAVPMSSLESASNSEVIPNGVTARVSVYEIGPYAQSLDRHIITFNCHGLAQDYGPHGLVNITVSPGSVLGAIGRAVCPKPAPTAPRPTGLPLAFLSGQPTARTGSTASGEKQFTPDLRGVAIAKLIVLNDFDVYLTRGKSALDWSQLSGLNSPDRAAIQRLTVANMIDYFFTGTRDIWSDDAKRFLALAYAWGISMPRANACEMAYSTNTKPDDACQQAINRVTQSEVNVVIVELKKHIILPP